ncbi:MAG TPA: cysteine synthase A [Verrucomicrobia bacterium]|nr:cysteine synthase A [Verrucomicrobiota bacterium]
MSIYDNNALSIGNTPLVRLHRIHNGTADLLAKVEGRNPAYSVKCRIGAHMVQDAENRGLLRPGMEIIEPTSGNTGIALAFVGASKGYHVTLIMPATMSIERRRVMKALGADIILTEGPKGMPGAIKKAEQMAAANAHRYFMPQQFKNPANPEIHYLTTAPEIWQDTAGKVDVLVAGVGTGGTITGIARYFKNKQGRAVTTVAVEPEDSPVITQAIDGQPIEPGPHGIQGIGAGFIPDILDLDLIDRVERVSTEEAMHYARRLAREEGLISGISCGAAAAAAVRIANDPAFTGRTIVVILPDSGERYLSTPLFDE